MWEIICHNIMAHTYEMRFALQGRTILEYSNTSPSLLYEVTFHYKSKAPLQAHSFEKVQF